MTKETYYQKINALEFEYANFNSGSRLAIPMIEAEMIAEEAEAEIEKLKGLLKFSLYYVQESGMCNILAAKIEEALNDE